MHSDAIKNRFIRWGVGADDSNARTIPANFTPGSYTPVQVAVEGTDKISAHLKGVDTFLSTIGSANLINVKPAPGTGEFSSIKAAVDSITTASSSNPFVVLVAPGVYVEDTITMKPYVVVVGYGYECTVIQVNATNKHVIVGADFSELRGFRLQGATAAGFAAVFHDSLTATTNKGFFVAECQFGTNDTLVIAEATAAASAVFVTECLYGGIYQFNRGFYANGAFGGRIIVRASSTIGMTAPYPSAVFEADGPNAEVVLNGVQCRSGGLTAGAAILLSNGGGCRAIAVNIKGFGTGVLVENTGSAPSLRIDDIMIEDCTQDVQVDHPGTTGAITCSADFAKVDIAVGATLSLFFTDSGSTEVGSVTLGSVLQGDRFDRLANLSLIARQGTTLGVIFGGVLSSGGGLTLNVTAGQGYLHDTAGDYIKEVNWSTTPLSVPNNTVSYILVNTNGTVIASPSLSSLTDFLVLGRIVTRAGQIVIIERSSLQMNHIGNKIEQFQRDAIGPIFATGSIVSESGTRNLDVTGGRYYYGTTIYQPTGAMPITFSAFYRDGISGYTVVNGQTVVDNAFYDNGSGTLAAITAGFWVKHSLYMVGDGADERYLLVYGQAQYSSLVAAEGADIPIPPTSFSDAVVLLASLIVRQGQAALAEVRDERPIIGFKASGVSASSDHGNLSGLLDDDHPQYLLVSGTRSMTGALNMGGNSITNVNLVDGVDVSAHAARHLPNGADPITTAAAIGVLPNNANGVGTANTLARADHSHALPNATGVTLLPDAGNAVGTANTVSRSDHLHNIPTAAAVGVDATTTNSQGVAATFARSDHGHAVATAAAVTQTPDQANAVGISAALARADHVHNIPTATAVSIGSANAQGAASTFAKSDHVHQGVHALKVNAGGTNRFGDIVLAQGNGTTITDGGAGTFTFDTIGGPSELYVTLPGAGFDVSFTAGKVRFNDTFTSVLAGTLTLTPSVADGRIYVGTNAVVASSNTPAIPAGAIPLASFTTSGAGVTALADIRTFLVPNLVWGLAGDIASVTAGAAAGAGISERYARADHKHAISTAAAATQTPNQANAEGASAALARADHVHNIPTAAGVTLSATTTNADGVAATFSRSDHTHAITTAVAVTLTPDQANAVGTAAGLSRADHVHNVPTAAPITIVPLAVNAQGVAATFAKSDHGHAIATAAAITLDATTAAAEGVASSFSRSDHAHAITTAAASTQTPDQANAVGTAAGLARADHAHNIPTAAAVTLDATTTNAQGAAATFARSNHTHAITTAAAVTQTPDQANAVGTAAGLARADHVHTIATAAPITIVPLGANAQGASTSFARADHGHAIATAAGITLDATTAAGAGAAASFSRSDHAHAITTAAAIAQTPDQANAVGTAAGLARADHVHNIATAAAVGLNANSTNTQGVAATFARSDHTHAISTGVVSAQTPDQANAAGTATTLARADHVHNIATAAAVTQDATSTNTQGSAATFARSDHTHAHTTAAAVAQTPDQANAVGTAAGFARADHVHNIATAAAVTLDATTANAQGAAATFARSNHTHAITTAAATAQTPDQANAVGTAAGLARADHVHNVPTAAATSVSTSTTNTQGAAATFARSDHTHAVSIINAEVTATTGTTTTSTTDVVLTGVTNTPGAGTYLVMFSAYFSQSANSNEVFATLYANGTIVTRTERGCTPRGAGGAASDRAGTSATAIITVAAAQAIDVRWRTNAGTATLEEGSLVIVRLSN